MTHPSATIAPDRLAALALELKAWLDGARTTTVREIRSYPTPIPRCDAQFNHLVEQRDRLSRLLNDLDAALDRRDDAGAALSESLNRLRALPLFQDSAEERDLRDRIGRELDRILTP